jgi:DNA-binding transcriptional regulator LsrR (DeoR family)
MTTAVRNRRRFGGLTPNLHDTEAHLSTQATQIMLEEAAFLRSFGTPWDQIAERLDIRPASLQRAIDRARETGMIGPNFPA